MKDYHINVFYSEEDEGYIADIPDLKYCSAFGETPVEAIQDSSWPNNLGLKPRKQKGRDYSLVEGKEILF